MCVIHSQFVERPSSMKEIKGLQKLIDKIRESGLLVGISAHQISIIELCEKKYDIDFFFVRGNHETRGPNARTLMTYFPHPSGKNYYSFNHGDVHFIILDSGEDKPDTHPVYAGIVDFDNYRTEQAEWLKKDINSEEFKKAKYKIAVYHIPLFTGSTKHGARAGRHGQRYHYGRNSRHRTGRGRDYQD